jgi:hypothetical protein
MLCGISCESGVHQTQTPKPNLSQLYLSRLSLAKLTKLNFFKTPASGRTGTRVAGTESHFNADPDPAFPNNADPDPAFPLMRIRTLQGSILSLQASTVSVNGKRPCVELLKLLDFFFNGDQGPDPAFHPNADPDPDPASKNNADPCGSATLPGTHKTMEKTLQSLCFVWVYLTRVCLL